jgi:hypothetical protein
MKTIIIKKMLAVSALVLTGSLFFSPAFADSYNNYDYDNNTVSYANAGPGGATAYYTNNTSLNTQNSNTNNCGSGNCWNNNYNCGNNCGGNNYHHPRPRLNWNNNNGCSNFGQFNIRWNRFGGRN